MPSLSNLPVEASIDANDSMVVVNNIRASRLPVSNLSVPEHNHNIADLQLDGNPTEHTFLQVPGRWASIDIPDHLSKINEQSFPDWSIQCRIDDYFYSYLMKLHQINEFVEYTPYNDLLGTCLAYEFMGGCLTPNGNIFLCPYNYPSARIINPRTRQVTYLDGFDSSAEKYFGAVLLKDHRILCLPYLKTKAAICYLSTLTKEDSQHIFTYPCRGGIVLDNGEVLCVPAQTESGHIEIYDAGSDSSRFVPGVPPGTSYWGAVSLPKQRYLVVPNVGQQGLIYDLPTNTLSLTCLFEPTPISTYFNGAAPLPDGRVFVTPYNGTHANIYDPITNTVSKIRLYDETKYGYSEFSGCVSLPNGSILCVPYYSHELHVYNPRKNLIESFSFDQVFDGCSGGVVLKDGGVVLFPYTSNKVNRVYLSNLWVNKPNLFYLTCPAVNKL